MATNQPPVCTKAWRSSPRDEIIGQFDVEEFERAFQGSRRKIATTRAIGRFVDPSIGHGTKRRIESAQKSPRSEDVATTGGRRLTRTPSPLGFHAAPRRSTSRRRSSRALTLVPCAFASSRFLSLPFLRSSPLPILSIPHLFRFEPCVFRFEGFREGSERERWRREEE